MPTTRSLLFVACTFASLVSAQTTVTLFSANFETDTLGQRPTDWFVRLGDPGGEVVANPESEAGNSSSQVLGLLDSTGSSDLDTPGIDLSPHADATTFTLSFDYYQSVNINTSLLIAFYDTTSGFADGISGDGFKWVGSDTSTGGIAGILFNFDPTAATTWEHFDIDVTSAVDLYLTETPSTDFSIAFQNWVGGSGGGAQDIYLDNLTLTATSAVPEPSTYAALAGLGALGLALWRRRRQATA